MAIYNDEVSISIPVVEFINNSLVTIENAESLEDWQFLPAYMAPEHNPQYPHSHYSSCSYCGVGDAVKIDIPGHGCSPKKTPSSGCVKFEFSRMKKNSAYPIQISPSIKISEGDRANISYSDAIKIFADLLLDYMSEDAQILMYACGQIDYFSIFAMQEVFRLLGVRNLTGNAEHCLNAGAVHNEILTGQEGPFVTIEQALSGKNKFYILNGWNGFVTHPPIFNQLLGKPSINAVLFDVMLTESGQALQNKLTESHVGLIKPASDPHIALAVAHRIFKLHPDAIEERFIQNWSDTTSFNEFKLLAETEDYAINSVVKRTAAEPKFEQCIHDLIIYIVENLIAAETVPIVIPSVGLSQSSGVVAHCLWGCVLAMLGKFGLNTESNLLGGVLRLPGQINAESEVQGLSRKFFMGRIPMSDAIEAARRMGLPDHAYEQVLQDEPIAALDYSERSSKRQLFIFFGTQFEANMPNRKKWLEKLTADGNKIIVVDPILDPWSIAHAKLIIPSPPHPATPKLYQNGEWRLSLSMPQKIAASQTRSDATIIYDVMAEITLRLMQDPSLRTKHPWLAEHLRSGYLQRRFCPPVSPLDSTQGLIRVDNEVSRVQLFKRIQDYLSGGCGPLYCSFENEDRQPIQWQDLLDQGSIIYGGVGKHRFMLDYTNCTSPFSDIYRKPRPFKFFVPSENDLQIACGIVLNSGRSSLSDNKRRVQFAIKSFNSGKATPVDDIPFQHPVHISRLLAIEYELQTGDWIKLSSANYDSSIFVPVVVSDRIFGCTIYMSFHRAKSQELQNLYINDITDNQARCAYSSQVKLKTASVKIEKLSLSFVKKNSLVDFQKIHNSSMTENLPSWSGENRDFIVSNIIHEAIDCTTFRLLPEIPCSFKFMPGQYCTLNLAINGGKQVRAYSISSSPTQKYEIDITVKRVSGGLASNWLADNLIIGDSLNVGTIAGDFYFDPADTSKKLLLIGAGSGITPLISMVRWLVSEAPSIDIDFYISTRHLSGVLFSDELISLENRMPNFNLWIIPTAEEYKDSKEILQGRISSEILKTISPDCSSREVFMCGPEGFMQSAKSILLELGSNHAKIHQESFGIEKSRPEMLIDNSMQLIFSSGANQQDNIISCNGGKTFLEISEDHGLGINSVCRSGDCGACLIKISGETIQGKTEQLTDEQFVEGYRLACICFPKGNCNVEIL